eukprot:gnl/MRDRNA2_/MRDRNA2_261428_c0_seq1.p1 gnl/MRDRNA2_/MRDRNA2_261428_c0~~gnl/MRDRNA2_/MRDRNA2_261428_c0_seq1.p1  ORF type:complete len:126 (-),score=28.51 gnl/MRDRNA2_/MRDRNA2_261428_c0_seq1:13-390(-)
MYLLQGRNRSRFTSRQSKAVSCFAGPYAATDMRVKDEDLEDFGGGEDVSNFLQDEYESEKKAGAKEQNEFLTDGSGHVVGLETAKQIEAIEYNEKHPRFRSHTAVGEAFAIGSIERASHKATQAK